MISGRPGLLFSAGLAAAAMVACSGPSEQEPRSALDAGRHSVEDVASHIIHLPDGSVDDLEAGQRLAVGDINDDGEDDLVIGVPGSDGPDEGRVDAGQIFVVSGGELPEEFDVASRSIVSITGATAGDNLGFAVATGDVDGDGVDDIVAGAINSNGVPEVRTDMGEVYIFFGGDAIGGERDVGKGEYDVLIQPAEGFSHLGTSLATGDLNGDEVSDLAVGAPYAGRTAGSPVGGSRTTTGEVYVILGRANLPGEILVAEGEQDFRLTGGAEFDQFGQSLIIGDADGDGVNDLVVGVPGHDPAPDLEDAGAVFGFKFAEGAPGQTSSGRADWTIGGTQPGGRFGNAVSISGAGQRLLLASAPTQGVHDRPGCGVVYSYPDYGGATVPDTSSPASVAGSAAGEFFPGGVIAVNSAIRPLFVLGSPNAESQAGTVFIIRDVIDGHVDLASPPEDASILLGPTGGRLGSALGAGDLDRDGRLDLALLSSGTSTANTTGSGTVYIVGT